MATAKIILKKNKEKANGEFPLYLRITKNRKTKFISLGYSIKDTDWDAVKDKVKRSHTNAVWLNHYLSQKIAEAETISLQLETTSRFISTAQIKKRILGQASESFLNYGRTVTKQYFDEGKVGTWKRYTTIINKIQEYLKGNDLSFEELNVGFLKQYETHLLKNGNSVNTVHTNLKTIRAIMYSAIREDLFPQEKNPFFKFKLKLEKTEKVRLPIDEIYTIRDLDLEANSVLWHCRNYFMFSFYCAGIRVSDLIQLKWKNIDNDKLSYKMGKTAVFKTIKLVPAALAILGLYKRSHAKPGEYIFPILSNEIEYTDKLYLYNQISSKTAIINNNLKKIAGEAEINKKLTFHISRHSFADYARTEGIPLYDISKALGHSNISITERYLNSFDDSSLDKTMDTLFSNS